MRYPYDNFLTEYNTTAGLGFGARTPYGFHEAVDINDNLGGNSDLGKPIYAIAEGTVTSIHAHAGVPTFGNHVHYKIIGPWGERWVHHAHCQQVLVQVGQTVTEGQLIARIGNSGTQWAHDHWAIKKQPTGIDGLATTQAALAMWENPVEFVKRWMIQTPAPQPPTPVLTPQWSDQTLIPLGGELGTWELQKVRSEILDRRKNFQDCDIERGSLKNQIAAFKSKLSALAAELKG